MRGRLEREGMYVYIELIQVVRQKLTQHCKVIIFQLKNKRKKKQFSLKKKDHSSHAGEDLVVC